MPDGGIDHLWIRVRDSPRPSASTRRSLARGLRIGVDELDHVQLVGDEFSFSLIDDERPLTSTSTSRSGAGRRDRAGVPRRRARRGYEDHGGPGERAVYHPGYYGAFVLDPTGTTSRSSTTTAEGVIPKSLGCTGPAT